ncbi:MAG: protein-disulfide reductase DsbD family protein [Vicinamibacterales bacterium]
MIPSPPLRRALVCAAAAAALTLVPGSAGAQASAPGSRTGQGPHVRVELIADRPTPGSGMRLGLKFDLDPEWHIYWQNPGDSGGPPQVAWTFPPGMMAAGIEWPAPERIDIGGLINYGYHGTVVLPVAVAVAADARIPREFTVAASVRWMACANLCVPGQAELELKFPLSDSETGQVGGWKGAIDAARGQVPKPAPASWKALARSTSDSFVVDVLTGSREENAVFFPLELSQVNDSAAQSATPLAEGVRLVLRKSSQLAKDPGVLRGVLALQGGRAYTIAASVR